MQLATYRYTPTAGWNRPLDPALDSAGSLLILFGPSATDGLAPGLAELRTTFPQTHWIGCSTSGQFLGTEIEDDSLVAALVRFDAVAVKSAQAPVHGPDDSMRAGLDIAAALASSDLRAVFVLADGLNVNGSEFVKGLQQVLPSTVIVTGGLAGDGSRFENTWVLSDRIPASHHVTAVGLYGENLGVASGSKGGWDMLGPERLVTRARANVLYELDGQPALGVYQRFLGERALGLPGTGLLFPLAIRTDNDPDSEIVRTLLAINAEEGSITFAGDIPEGSNVRLMHANFERLIDAASNAAESMDLGAYHGGPLLCVAISCVGRRLVLGQRTEEEIEATYDVLPAGAQQIGYYSYGEISPQASGRCDLHNQTMTLTLFWEKSINAP